MRAYENWNADSNMNFENSFLNALRKVSTETKC